jgi:hypothetical protein
MKTTPNNFQTPDELDRLFSDFFKAQLKNPWPNAPGAPSVPLAATPRVASEPRTVPAPVPAVRPHDGTSRARLTLAASVALVLGTCWYLSNGLAPGPRPTVAPIPSGPGRLGDSDAKGIKGGVLDKLNEDKAKGNVPPKFDMEKIE